MTNYEDRDGIVQRVLGEVLTPGSCLNDLQEISQGMGKRSFVLDCSEGTFIIQIRGQQDWYEPVREVTALWAELGCPIIQPVKLFEIDKEKVYVFPWVDWPSVSQWLKSKSNRVAGEVCYSIGSAIRSLCDVPTTNYGVFATGLDGQCATWEKFVLQRLTDSLSRIRNYIWVPFELILAVDQLVEMDLGVLYTGCPQLIYVDVSLDNVLINPEDRALTIIDYDYLISGDPWWAAARFDVFNPEPARSRAFISGFARRPEERPASSIYEIYCLCHALELLSTASGGVERIRCRRGRLIRRAQLLAERRLRSFDRRSTRDRDGMR